jgi:hypothetical protein
VDRASARAFVVDATRYVRALVSHRLQVSTAARRFVERLESSCPGALAQAPPPIIEHVKGAPPWHGGGEGTPQQQMTSQTFLTLALGELRVIGYAPIRAPALAFANELLHLPWADPVIARALGDLGQSILATLTLRPPDLCADARASQATGFAAAPPEATQFADACRSAARVSKGRNLAELASNLAELAGMVRPFLSRSDLPALAHFQRLWSRAKPLVEISGRVVGRLMQAVFAPHA